MRVGYWVPGEPTIPEMISRNKTPYYKALEAADKSVTAPGTFDLSELEGMQEDLLAKQLLNIHGAAKDGGA